MRYSNYRRWVWGGFLCVLTAAMGSPTAKADLVAHYKLDDSSGFTAVDSVTSPTQLNGTLTGHADGNGVFDSPMWVTGIDGGAAQFGDSSANTDNKLDDVIEVANSGVGSKLDLNGALTIAAWIRLDENTANGTGSTRHIAGKDRAGGGTGDGYGLNHSMSGGADVLRFIIADNDTDTTIVSSSTLTDLTAASVAAGAGGWVHVAGVYVPNTSMKLYINGQLDTELTAGVPIEAESVTTTFNIGRLEGSSTHSFYGLIDDVQVYDTALTDAQVFAATGLITPVPTLRVDRITGAMTLENASFATASLNMQGYSITSALGALYQDGWKPIAGNYDDSSGGNGSVDNDDEWTVLSANGSATDLSEYQFGGSPGNGGSIAVGDSVVLGQGDGAWIPSEVEDDLEMRVSLAGGAEMTIPIVYEGNGGEPLSRSDLNTDGSLTGADWLIFSANFPSSESDLSGLTSAKAHALGDVIRDGEIGVSDFQAFKEDYLAENGPGSFEAMLQSIPEPSSMLLALCALGFVAARSRFANQRHSVRGLSTSADAHTIHNNHSSRHYGQGEIYMRSSNYRNWLLAGCLLALACALAPSQAAADLVAHWKLDDGQIDSTTTTAIDSVAPPSNGTLENFPSPPTPKWVSGISGGALEFGANGNGTGADGDDVVTTPSTGKLDITGALTISAWVLLDEDGGRASTRHIAGIDMVGGATGDAYSLKHLGSTTDVGKVAFLIAQGGDTNLVSSDTLVNYKAASVTAGNGGWVHVAGVYVPSTSMTLYINGVQDAQLLTGVPSAIDSVSTPFNIGRLAGDVTTHSFHGAIDDVQVYNSALSDEEVLALTIFTTDFKASIHPVSGEVVLRNETADPIDFDYYRLDSDTGAFKPLGGDWFSLSDRVPPLDPVNGGNDPGETWSEGGNSDASVLTELFLQGSTELAAGESLSLGPAYDPGVGGTPTFEYQLAGTTTVLNGTVEFMLLGDMDGNGALEDADVNPFVEALTNRSSYEANYPDVDADLIGDFDGNGQLDLGDVGAFRAAVAALPGSSASAATAVPEPSTGVLCVLALAGLLAGTNSRRNALCWKR